MRRILFRLSPLLLTLLLCQGLSPGYARQAPMSVFNSCTPVQFETVTRQDLFKEWYPIPVTTATDMFNPVFLEFTYKCDGSEPDPKQPLTFPSLLSFKFDFVPDNYNSRHAAFIFRRDPEVSKIKPGDTEEIAGFIKSWQATHCIGGELIQTKDGYGGTMVVFDATGRQIFSKAYPARLPYFELMGEMVRDWMLFRDQPVGDGLYQELTRPMTRNPDSIRRFGTSYDLKWRSPEEWSLFEAILKDDLGFGELQFWYANQRGWEDGDKKWSNMMKGKAILDHPVMSALWEFIPDSCSDRTLVDNYRKVVDHMEGIAPNNPYVIGCRLELDSDIMSIDELNAVIPIALKYPACYKLLNELDFAYKTRRCYEKAIPLYLSSIYSGYLPGTGSFNYEFAALGSQFSKLGMLPESYACNMAGLSDATGDDRSWLNMYLGYDFEESFNFSKAAAYYREKYRLSPSNYYCLLRGYMSLFEGGLSDTIAEWEKDPLTKPVSTVVQPFITARKAVTEGKTREAISALDQIPFAINQGDKDYQFEAEIIRADALLLVKDKKALQHATNAWLINPRSRRTAYLIEKTFGDRKSDLYRFAQAGKYIFPNQAYWRSLCARLEEHGAKMDSDRQIVALYQKLLNQIPKTSEAARVFWMKQPPFQVEYLCSWMIKIPEQREAALGLYRDYTLAMQGLSEYQKVHTHAFFCQLLTGCPEGERLSRLQEIEGSSEAIILYNQAERYYDHRQYKQAITEYQNVIAIKSDYADAYYKLGWCYLKLKQYPEAVGSFQKAIANEYGLDYAYNGLGLAYTDLGKYQEAIGAFQAAVAVNPTYAIAYYNLGNAYSYLKRYPEAIDAYQQSLVNKPTDYGYENLGNTFNQVNRLEDAVTAYQNAIKLNPRNGLACKSLGDTLFGLKRYQEAAEVYKKAVTLLSSPYYLYDSLGNCFYNLKQYPSALDSYLKVVANKPDYALGYYHLGNTYKQLERFEDALAAYNKAITLNSKYWQVYEALGDLYYDKSRFAEAVEAYQTLTNLIPQSPPAWYQLGLTYQKMARYNDALSALGKVIQLKPDDIDALFQIGYTYGLMKQYDEAITAYKKALVYNPNLSNAHVNLGICYYNTNRFQEAITANLKAISIKPTFVRYYNLGLAYFYVNQYTEAVAAFQKALEFEPTDANAHYELGKSSLQLQDIKAAEREYSILKGTDPELAEKLRQLITEKTGKGE